MRDAPVAAGKYPLILLSHGAGLAGSAQALSWIATPLAKHGFVVAAPTHPGNTGPKRSAAETMKLWLRPADLTETLNTMVGSAMFRDHLEDGKVGVLGLSMGGNTALAISGARLSPTRLAGYCDTDALNPSLCGWVKQTGVDLHKLDMKLAGRDNRESRVRFAMAIDPAPVDVLDPRSFSGIEIPVEIVNLGKTDQIPVTANAGKVAKTIPKAQYTVIEHASHYSMFGECKPGAAELAEKEDVGDPICSDGDGRSRSRIHTQLVDTAISAFDRALRGSP
jgi:predicted dienelactone hydrolase